MRPRRAGCSPTRCAGPGREDVALADEVVDGQQLDGGDTEADEVVDDRRMGEAGVGPPVLLGDGRMAGGQRLDVGLVDDRAVERRPGPLVGSRCRLGRRDDDGRRDGVGAVPPCGPAARGGPSARRRRPAGPAGRPAAWRGRSGGRPPGRTGRGPGSRSAAPAGPRGRGRGARHRSGRSARRGPAPGRRVNRHTSIRSATVDGTANVAPSASSGRAPTRAGGPSPRLTIELEVVVHGRAARPRGRSEAHGTVHERPTITRGRRVRRRAEDLERSGRQACSGHHVSTNGRFLPVRGGGRRARPAAC